MACESKRDTSNDRGNWNHLKIIQTKPQQYTGKAQNQGTTNVSHLKHRTHNSKSTKVK